MIVSILKRLGEITITKRCISVLISMGSGLITSPSLWIFWDGIWDDFGIWIDTELMP